MTLRGAVSVVVVASAGMLGACVTVYEDAPWNEVNLQRPEFAVAQTIPLGAGAMSDDQRPLFELYDGVLKSLHEAAAERDLPGMQALLDTYERDNLPSWVRDRLAGYRSLAHGIGFEKHAAAKSSLQLAAAVTPAGAAAGPEPTAASKPPAIGAPLLCEFALPAPAEPVWLGGSTDDDPTGLAIAITIEDTYVNGNTFVQKDNQRFVWFDEAIDLRGSTVLRQPIAFEVPAGDAVQRTVHLRVDLMTGYVTMAGQRCLVRRTTVAAMSVTQWPAGSEVIAKKPLATLREAQRLGDAAHFPHVYLGAVFATGDDRETALALLIDQVRFGSQPQAVVAMAALRAITAVNLTVGDRDAWLAWWQMRR